MAEELGSEKTKALEKYVGVVSLTKWQAREILQAVYPDAPEAEMARAVLLCASYQLNPLMKHVFLIPFNKGTPKETWATVIGIKAKRLMASRRDSYSYVDNTPRVMTEEEQKTIFGMVYADRLCVMTKVRDPGTGAEAVGYGFWLHKDTIYGTDKGNSAFNMASIRSESQALDRLRPGEMPVGVEVMPEDIAEAAGKEPFIEGEAKVVEEQPLEPEQPEPEKATTKKPKTAPAQPVAELPQEPMGEMEPAQEKDETPITPAQLNQLNDFMAKAEMSNTDLGQYCNRDKSWNIREKKDLKKWQFDDIVAKIKKGLGEG